MDGWDVFNSAREWGTGAGGGGGSRKGIRELTGAEKIKLSLCWVITDDTKMNSLAMKL